MSGTDLFGNPLDPTPPAPAPVPPSTNDMDLVQAVLADVADRKTAALHHDPRSGAVRRCATRGDLTAVPSEYATAANQLIDARYLTTVRRGCDTPAHGPVITATHAGRAAVCRWRAYRRPASWGPLHR